MVMTNHHDLHAWDDDDEDDLDGEEKTEGEGGEDEEPGSKSDEQSAETGTSLQSGCNITNTNTNTMYVWLSETSILYFTSFYKNIEKAEKLDAQNKTALKVKVGIIKRIVRSSSLSVEHYFVDLKAQNGPS